MYDPGENADSFQRIQENADEAATTSPVWNLDYDLASVLLAGAFERSPTPLAPSYVLM